MKKFLRFAVLFLIIPAFVFTACSDDDDDDPVLERKTDVEFQTLITHLKTSNLDLDDILTSWITTAANVSENPSTHYVIDIRSADVFAAGHIEGAVNSTLADILTTAENANGKKIVVACYTGQGAGHAVCALRLSGYTDAQVLKWGMSGWNSTLSGSWENNTGSGATGNANWTAAPGAVVTQTTEFDDPNITETGTGAEILTARVAALLSSGFRGVTNATVLGAPGSYYINNYWASTDIEHYGNITGAYSIKPLTLTGNEYINLDPSKDVVTYCWTGQTSSVITAYLYILGYDSYSLKFGANGMIYDALESHKWSTPTTDLTLVQ